MSMLVRKLVALLCILCSVSAWGADVIRVGTQNVDLIFRVGNNKRLKQVYLGRKLLNDQDLQYLTEGQEAYLTHGMEDYFEPAIQVEHNDHNSSLELKYVSHEKKVLQNGVDEIIVTLQDDKYPVTVKLHYVTYFDTDIIKAYTEISHKEKKPLLLHRYASSMLHLDKP